MEENKFSDEAREEMIEKLERESIEIQSAPKVEAKKANPIALKGGVYTPKDSVELGGILEMLSRGGAFPKSFDTKEKRLAVYNLAVSIMGHQWHLALNNIAEIHGKLSIYGELPRTLAERTKEVEEFEVYIVNEKYERVSVANKNLNDEPFAGVCNVKRKGRVLKEYVYTLEDAKNGGQYPPKFASSPWIRFLKMMLMRKAQAIAIKFEFPEALVGVPIAEYDDDLAPDLVDVREATKVQHEEFKQAYETPKTEAVD